MATFLSASDWGDIISTFRCSVHHSGLRVVSSAEPLGLSAVLRLAVLDTNWSTDLPNFKLQTKESSDSVPGGSFQTVSICLERSSIKYLKSI